MRSFEEDTLLRQVRQLGNFVAALVARARAGGDFESGLKSVRAAFGSAFGIDRELIERLDPPSVALLLGGAERIEAYAQVCDAEADLLAGMGRDEAAARARSRAGALRGLDGPAAPELGGTP